MNALVRKEIRLVLPAWSAAMVLAIFPVWLVWPGERSLFSISQSPGIAVYAPFALGALLLGLASFAQELNFGTFSMLLAQPVSRRHLWRVKTAVLAIALGFVFVALWVSLYIRSESVIETLKATDLQNALQRPVTAKEVLSILADLRINILIETLLLGGICTLAAFSSGLWTNLLFRNTSAAFWFSLLIPLGLGLLAEKLFSLISPELPGVGAFAILVIYSAIGFIWARKFFLRVQDTQWTGGILSLPTVLGSKTGSTARNQKPWRALVRKEFQLHQINLLIAGLLLVTHVVVLIVRRMSADYFVLHRSAAMIWEAWPMLWLAMPLLIGGVTVAEERKLGTLENFLCLPTTRRREFAVKLFMAMLLGVFLGGVMPLALEWLGTLAGLSRNVFDTSMTFNWKPVSLLSELLLGAAGLTFLALYASTLTRNLLQALGLALVLSLFSFFILALADAVANGQWLGVTNGQWLGQGQALLWRGPLIGLIGWPVMVVSLVSLAYGNFKQLQVGGKIWRRNLVIVFASLAGVAVATTVTYHRVWELWMPDEPPHRFYGGGFMQSERRLATTPKISTSISGIATILPRGQLWLRQRPMEAIQKEVQGHTITTFHATGPQREGYVAGSNWRDVAISRSSCYAIQADGSLWDLSELQSDKSGVEFSPKPFVTGRGWKSISGSEEQFAALKSDGTLWEWGWNFKTSSNTVVRKLISLPTQVGTDTDWIAACVSWNSGVAMKSDGSIWKFGVTHSYNTNKSWSVETLEQPRRWLSFERRDPASLSFDGETLVVTCEDGTLWLGGSLTPGLFKPDAAQHAAHEMIRWGNDVDWKEVKLTPGWGRALGIKIGGSLWAGIPNMHAPEMDWVNQRTMQSHYYDWIAVCPYDNGSFLALSAEGQLCLWDHPHQQGYDDYSWSDPSLLLQPSRIKARTIAELHR